MSEFRRRQPGTGVRHATCQLQGKHDERHLGNGRRSRHFRLLHTQRRTEYTDEHERQRPLYGRGSRRVGGARQRHGGRQRRRRRLGPQLPLLRLLPLFGCGGRPESRRGGGPGRTALHRESERRSLHGVEKRDDRGAHRGTAIPQRFRHDGTLSARRPAGRGRQFGGEDADAETRRGGEFQRGAGRERHL